MRSEAESTDYTDVHYEADKPRRRDFLRVLLGQWTPTVHRATRLSAAALSETWDADALAAQIYDGNPLPEIEHPTE
jgi:hypothetical protein